MATETKKIELSQTNSALAELSSVLLKLNEAIEEKKGEIAATRKKGEIASDDNSKRLELLKASSQNIINNIDSVITKLDKILENDGTSNNHN